jgi:hypothetical protein
MKGFKLGSLENNLIPSGQWNGPSLMVCGRTRKKIHLIKKNP